MSVAEVLKTISDTRSLELFKTVAVAEPCTDILISKTKLTRKQYYSRMSSLMNVGLIKRKNGKYTLTTFGKVIYEIINTTVKKAVDYYWKLKAIDSIAFSDNLPSDQLEKLVDNFIDNQEIKAVLASSRSEHKSYLDIRTAQKGQQGSKPGLLVS